MSFTIDEDLLPATLTAAPMSDAEFADFCVEHPDLRFEMTAEGEIIVMPPTFTATGLRNSQIGRQLGNWAEQDGHGFAADSSTGYLLSNGARRSPGASWTRNEATRNLPESSRDGFWHLCPAFVIELRSKSDRLPALREKMGEYLANGAELGWLIDPETRTVEVYRPDREPEWMTGIDSVTGEGPVEGFVLELVRVWDPLSIAGAKS